MKKKILKSLLLLLLCLINVTVLASPSVEYIFYDNDDKILYVFGGYDKPSEDVGVYFAGDKFSLIKDGDTSSLDKSNKMESPKFGIGFKAQKSYFEKVLVIPYVSSESVEEKGQKKYYDYLTNSLKENCVFYENFANDYKGGSQPEYEDSKSNQGVTEVTKDYNDNGNLSSMLKFTNPKGNGHYAGATFEIPKYQDYITLEFKVKMINTAEDDSGFGFIIDFSDKNGVKPFRIIKYGGKNTPLNFVNNRQNHPLCDVIKDNEWYIIRVKVDSKNKVSSVAIFNDSYKEEDLSAGYKDVPNDFTKSDETEDDNIINDIEQTNKTGNFTVLKQNYMWQDRGNGALYTYNLLWYQEYEGGNVEKVTFNTYGNTQGEYLIDYVALYDKDGDYKKQKLRAKSDEIGNYSDPVMRLVPDKTNIVLNDEVYYSPYEPVIKDDVIFIEVETIADILNMNFEENQNEYILINNSTTFKFTKDSDIYYFNNKEKPLSSNIIILEDEVYLPLLDVIKCLNYRTEFKSEEKVLYVNKNISVDLNEWLNKNIGYKDVLTVYTLEETRE